MWNCGACLTLVLLLVSERVDGVNSPSWVRALGFGRTPPPGREGWGFREFEPASAPSSGRPVHRGADPNMAGSRRPFGFSVVGSERRTVGACAIAKGLRISGRSTRRGLHSAELAGLLAVKREPGCKLAVSVLALPDRRPGRSVGCCSDRSFGAGGSRPLAFRGDPSKCGRSVGSWRVGPDRPNSSWRCTTGRSSASPGSRPAMAWIH